MWNFNGFCWVAYRGRRCARALATGNEQSLTANTTTTAAAAAAADALPLTEGIYSSLGSGSS